VVKGAATFQSRVSFTTRNGSPLQDSAGGAAKEGILCAALLILGDEHPGAPQRQLGSKCFRQPIVDLKQRIEDFILSQKPDTEIQLVPTLLNGLLEPSPTEAGGAFQDYKSTIWKFSGTFPSD
jgi:hypothetical protein